MSEKIKNQPISFRLNEENNEKLQDLADSNGIQKSTMTANIVVNVLNENLEELLINHISYPRPIIKKLFTMLTPAQVDLVISDLNEYNKGIIESAKQLYPTYRIINLMRKWMKRSGCEVSITTFKLKKVLEVHHEMEKNWSIVTCTTTAYILQLLDNQIERTFVDENWFKIEYFSA